MAIIIRMKRMGKTNTAFYRIVVADERKSAKGGPYIEELGYYNPVKNPAEIKVDVEKAKAWQSKGAKVSETVKSILKKSGAYIAPANTKKKKKKEKKAKTKK